MAESALAERGQVTVSERSLAVRAARGDAAAYDALLQPRLERLYRTAMAILRHEADARDALQDACVRSWRQVAHLREPDRFDAWVTRILVNTCRDRLRSRRRSSVREIDIAALSGTPAEPAGRVSAVADRVAELDSVRRAFLRLRAEERVLLALHHADKRPVDEIATLLQAPAGTIKRRLHSARRALATALEREQ